MRTGEIQCGLQTSFAEDAEHEIAMPEPLREATNVTVRRVLCASAIRGRNLSVLAAAGVSAMILAGLGLNWVSLIVLGVGMAGYAALIGSDAVDEKFLCQLLSIGEPAPGDGQSGDPYGDDVPLNLSLIDDELCDAYKALLQRRNELQELLGAGPVVLRASISEGERICDSLLANARRLVWRGQRLHSYLSLTELDCICDSACEAVLEAIATDDRVAATTYQQVVIGKQRHMETHIQVEGLYDRVLAQLALIETTLAGAVAKIVKITATDDEESSLTASLVHEELELLMTDVRILETSLEEVSQPRQEESNGYHRH